ncbi:iron ABC transporter permease [uncultured Gordonia sp.]|uniref:ABC transporter permease n=1 Tax=uncultured Gordonia sp. TaxID=198437 RepID=UPI00259A437A|nr:iron ABC transporter permease [uncultured Gordonia sp.]
MLVVVPAVGVSALVVLPAVYLIVRVVEAGWETIGSALLRPRTLELLWNTVRLAGAVTALSVILGVGLAWCVTHAIGRGRPMVITLLAAPLAIPSYVSGFVWVRMVPGFEGFGAAVLVLTLACYPLIMLPTIAALSGVGRSAEDVARTLGSDKLRTFLRVTVPRIRGSVAAGALLVALYTISDFGGPAIVRFEPFTVGIYNAYNGSFDRSVAAVYGCVLAVMAIVLATSERVARPREAVIAHADRGRSVQPSAWAWLCVVTIVGLGVVFPIVGLCTEIAESQRVNVSFAELMPAAWATLSLSVQAAAVITVLAIPVALCTAAPRTRLGSVVETSTYIGYALPGITVGLSLVFIGIRLVPQWYQTTGLLIAAYAVLFLPVCVGPLRSSLDSTSRTVGEIAQTLGAGPASTILRVSLAAAAPGVLAGAAMVCLSVAKELPATLMLAPLGTRTLAADMWSLNNDLSYGQSAVAGLTLIAVSSLPMVALSSLLSRREVSG